MPKTKKRGRRHEKLQERGQEVNGAAKRKYNDSTLGETEEDLEQNPTKHQRTHEDIAELATDDRDVNSSAEADYIAFEESYEGGGSMDDIDRPFYGLLQDEEQEYFRRADELLELNDFPSHEERALFLSSVFRETEGKELKVACSQSCSRLMERLILASTAEQKKMLFRKFTGNWTHLIQHRFASHCCEALFVHSGVVVEEELLGKKPDGNESMELLFLQALDELESSITTLLTSKFASHSLRILLVVLSGRPLEQSSSLLQSKKKENKSISDQVSNQDKAPKHRPVPPSFHQAIHKIISDIVQSMEPSFIRILTTHPTGNPTLQLLLELELTTSKSNKSAEADTGSMPTLLAIILPDSVSDPASQSQILLNDLVYHPVGSHLVEVLLQYGPSKLFKSIYGSILFPKLTSLARNDIACYPLIRALTRLSKEDLQRAITEIIPSLSDLVTKQRIIIIKVLFERCSARGADASELTGALEKAYGCNHSTLIQNMFSLDPTNIPIPPSLNASIESESGFQASRVTSVSPQQTHASLLAQAMLALPGPARELILESILSVDNLTLLRFALYPPSSRVLQASLSLSSPSTSSPIFHRKVLGTLLAPLPQSLISNSASTSSTIEASTAIHKLAHHHVGSYTLEAIFYLTTSPLYSSLFVYAERVVAILSSIEGTLQSTNFGRRIWRLWSVGTWKWDAERWGRNVRGERAVENALLKRDLVKNTEEEKPNRKSSKQTKNIEKENIAKAEEGKVRKRTAIETARARFAAEKMTKETRFQPRLQRGR